MDQMQGQAAPQGKGSPEEVMQVFQDIGDALGKVAPIMDAAPPEAQKAFMEAKGAYDNFLKVFTGGAEPMPAGQGSPEQAGNPNVEPVR